MNELKFKNLSCGYAGEQIDNASLNSSFFGNLVDSNLETQLTFPQRVPKAMFFEELCKQEKPSFSKIFKQRQNRIKTKVTDMLINAKEKKYTELLNWINLMFRFALFEDIYDIKVPQDCDHEIKIEIELIREMSKIQICLSNGVPAQANELLFLVEKIIQDKYLDEQIKIKALNRIVVLACRFDLGDEAIKNNVKKYGDLLLNLLSNYQSSELRISIMNSVAYRGLAMISEYGNEVQSKYLEKAEEFARSARSSNYLENLVIKENLFTCLQTLSKWNGFTGNNASALKNLQEMIELDPFDSVGYSELGFFFIKRKNYSDAAESFEKASNLGPPSLGMNTYYYAKSLYLLEKYDEAIQGLYMAAKYDEQALSPYLDLMDLFLDLKNISEAKKIAKHIHQSSTLKEQLEKDELLRVENVISI